MKTAPVLRLAFGLVLMAVVLGPLMMMVWLSLNPDEANITAIIGSAKAFFPSGFSLQNYREIIADPYQPFLRYLFNTLFVAFCVICLGVLVNSAAAFALAWGHGRYRSWVMALIIAVFVIPGEGLTIPLILMVSRWGWLDTYQVQIVPFIASAFSIFLFYQFFTKLPAELIEAARIDGASLFTTYLKIGLPLSKPVIATTAILGFLDIWNSYLWPSMVTRGVEFRPLSVAMAAFFGNQQSYWGNITAFAVLMALPVIVVFLIFQRWFVASVVGSGVKG